MNYYPMQCTTCGCVGNEEDGCEVGGECPTEGCDGIVTAALTPFTVVGGFAYDIGDFDR